MKTKTEHFKRIAEIRAGLREAERPSYFELTAWISSMKSQENLKGILRRVSCIARNKDMSLEQVKQCVNYGFHTLGGLPDVDERDMIFFGNPSDQEEFFDVVQKQYGLPKPVCVSNFCLLPETSEINRKHLLEDVERLGGRQIKF